MKYINVFDTNTGFNPAALDKPQLSLIKEDNTIHCLNIPHTDMVDLELPSRRLWSVSNFGATCGDTPDSWYGDYYAWAETETKSNYSGASAGAYKWGIIDWGSSIFNLTKYNNNTTYGAVIDNKSVLDTDDDITTLTYGTEYSMPSKEDMDELRNTDNATNEWVTDYQGITGLNGRLFTSTRNSNTLFIPASGYYSGTTKIQAGTSGYIWTKTLYPTQPYRAWCLSIANKECYINYLIRSNGYTVRVVK